MSFRRKWKTGSKGREMQPHEEMHFDDFKLPTASSSSQAKWVPKDAGSTSTAAAADQSLVSMENDKELHEDVPPGSSKQVRTTFAQAQLRATFYPKFENEKSDQEVRTKMIEVVESGGGVLEVSLKHSGSLFMYSGDHGGAYAKNSYGNLYTAVGVYVLGRTLQEAWGDQASQKQEEFNNHLETSRLCISMELVTAVLGDHGQRPKQDYVVVTAISDLKKKPRFYSTPDLIAFCRQWRLPTNHVWLFSSRKSATSVFTAYDALCEEGTASAVSKILDEVSDISVPASKSHADVQGEILEGLVARIVTPESVEKLQKVLEDFPLAECKDQPQLRTSLREICAQHTSEKAKINALLKSVGQYMCSDWSDWTSAKERNTSLLTKFLRAKPVDYMTTELQEMLAVLKDRNFRVHYPCYLKSFDPKLQKTQYKMTVHVLDDYVFRKYQIEMRRNPELWPLYRGFFMDVHLINDRQEKGLMTHLADKSGKDVHTNRGKAVMLANESENLMVKLKFLPYKIRTFLIRNGLSILFDNGFPEYRKYYFGQMNKWQTSADKKTQLDHLLTEWAQYITGRFGGRGPNNFMYLSEVEPFLEQFAKRGLRNRNLVGYTETEVRFENAMNSWGEFRDAIGTTTREASKDIKGVEVPLAADEGVRGSEGAGISLPAEDPREALKSKGMIVFFPGIPGCGKSALCKELLNDGNGLADGRIIHTLMGDLVKGKYWPQLARQRQRGSATAITLADKNAPNLEVWKTIEDMCRSTSAVGVPVVPDCEGAELNPFSIEVLALFTYRVLQRVDHPGNLDKKSPNAGYVLLLFYNLYAGKDRKEFEDSFKRHFGHLVKLPVLKESRPCMPSSILDTFTRGLELYKRHSAKHKRLDSTQGVFQQDWSNWEKQLRAVLNGNAAYFQVIQVPFEEMFQSVRQQLVSILSGETGPESPIELEQRAFKSIVFAAISLSGEEITNTLQKLAASNTEVEKYFKGRKVVVKSAHLTLAHKHEHGVAEVAVFGDVRGASVAIKLTALLFSNKVCALEAQIPDNDSGIFSRNKWPHITVWTSQGTKAKEANFLPQFALRNQASRVNFEPIEVSGVVELF